MSGRVRRWVSRRRPKLGSLRTTFAVSFATVTAAVTVVVGVVSYNAAARLVRVDQESVFDEVVQDLRAEVRERAMDPADFSSVAPGHDIVRPARTDVQVLGADGRIFDPGNPGLPVKDADREIAAAPGAGTIVEHKDVDVGSDVYRVATVALGGGRGAVQVAQEFSDTEDLLRALQQRTLILMGAVVTAAGLFGWWLARRITHPWSSSPPPPRTSPARVGSASRFPSPATTRWDGSAAPSTACWAASPSRRRTSGGWCRTPGTSCVRR